MCPTSQAWLHLWGVLDLYSTTALRDLIRRWTGLRVYRSLPRGIDPFVDLQQALPGFNPTLVFDVGANVGQSAARFRAAYPGARLHCFEPVPETYVALSEALADDPLAECHPLALGSIPGFARVRLEGTSDRARIDRTAADDASTGSVSVDTLSEFCALRGIAHISYLKVDTEGHDLEVLRGGESMFAEGRVSVVEVEAGMSPDNDLHVPYEQLAAYLQGFGYRLFGLYEQVPESPTGRPQLRRTNPVFISPELARAGDNA